MTTFSNTELSIALSAVLHEAQALGYDIEKICEAATNGLFDGAKPYRGGSASYVTGAQDAIKEALKDAKN